MRIDLRPPAGALGSHEAASHACVIPLQGQTLLAGRGWGAGRQCKGWCWGGGLGLSEQVGGAGCDVGGGGGGHGRDVLEERRGGGGWLDPPLLLWPPRRRKIFLRLNPLVPKARKKFCLKRWKGRRGGRGILLRLSAVLIHPRGMGALGVGLCGKPWPLHLLSSFPQDHHNHRIAWRRSSRVPGPSPTGLGGGGLRHTINVLRGTVCATEMASGSQ